jgi:heme exporter protein B
VKEAFALFRRDVMLAWREGGTIGTALGFYLVVVAITPLGLGPDLNLLSRIAPGVLWVALLLASLLSADRIFHNDYEDGALDVLATGPLPLELVAAAKSLAHWVTTGIPLALLAPVLGLLLNLPIESFPLLVLSMLAGTPAVSFVAGIGASLTLGLRRSGLLLALRARPTDNEPAGRRRQHRRSPLLSCASFRAPPLARRSVPHRRPREWRL